MRRRALINFHGPYSFPGLPGTAHFSQIPLTPEQEGKVILEKLVQVTQHLTYY